jgi:mRNA-degrading endonuclease RelE of RelBE toxin-antitoxin system
MDIRFHCSRSARKSLKKSKHNLANCCETLQAVLALDPDRGVLVPGWNGLRKMRLQVPGLNCGKSGGYRLIYRSMILDEAWHIVFLRAFFKGDMEDLPYGDYAKIQAESDDIFANPLGFQWDDF